MPRKPVAPPRLPDPPAAWAVAEYLAFCGLAARDIARELNRAGHRTRHGSRYAAQTVRAMLAGVVSPYRGTPLEQIDAIVSHLHLAVSPD
jgi:hypothetical protein